MRSLRRESRTARSARANLRGGKDSNVR